MLGLFSILNLGTSEYRIAPNLKKWPSADAGSLVNNRAPDGAKNKTHNHVYNNQSIYKSQVVCIKKLGSLNLQIFTEKLVLLINCPRFVSTFYATYIARGWHHCLT